MPRKRWLAVALLCGTGCGRPAEAEERDRVLHALDALRDAPGEARVERRRLLEALAETKATSAAAARARDTCVAAYRALLDGAEDLASAAPSPRLLEAERKINQSRTLMPDCERAIVDLRLGRR